MGKVPTYVARFVRDEQGIAVTEYGLLVALVAVALILVTRTFGSNISAWFGTMSGRITVTS